MANEQDIIVRIKAEGTGEFIKGLKRAEGAVEDVGDEVEKTEKKVDKSTDRMSSSFKAVGGAIAAAFATAQISAFIKESVRLADIQLKAEAQLLKGLKGREDVQKRLIKQAKELQKVTTFGDEQIIAQQAYLANLEFTEKQIKEIIKASVDLSAGANIPLESSVRNLAKTYSGLSGELGELIPQLRDLTQDQLKNGEGVKVITELYEGQAKVLRETGTGAVESLQNAVGDLREELGKAVINGLIPLTNSLQDLAENEDVINFFRGIGVFIGDALKAAGFAVKVVAALGGDLANLLGLGGDDAPVVDTVESVSAELENQIQLLEDAEDAWRRANAINADGSQNENINAIAGAIELYRSNVEGLERQLNGLKQIEAEISAAELLQKYLDNLNSEVKEEEESVIDLTNAWKEFESAYISVAGAVNDVTLFEDLPEKMVELAELALAVGFNLATGMKDAVPTATEEVEKAEVDIDARRRSRLADSQRLTQEALQVSTAFINAEQQILENRFAQGLISEKEYQEQRAELQTKAAKANKANAIFEIGLNTASAITAALRAGPIIGPILAGVVGALAAAQLAAVIKTPIPKFAKGTRKVGDGYELGEDRTLAWLNKDERVITAQDNKKHYGLYNAIEDGDVNAMIKEMASMGVAVQFNAGKLLADELDRPMKTLKQIKGDAKSGIDWNPLLNASERSRRSLRGELMRVNHNLEQIRKDGRKMTRA